MALSAGGENVELKVSKSDSMYLYASLVFGFIAIIFGLYFRKKVTAMSPGDEKMQEVGLAIREGAMAYLAQQRNTISIFIVLLGAGLFAMYLGKYGALTSGLLVLCFVLGVAASYVAGYLGMDMAVKANMRTAAAALTSPKSALEVAFQAGAVAGLLTVGMGLLGATIIFIAFPADAMKLLIGFGFGGSLAALFMRVGGGIYTKAADVGADLVGKVEAGIPEDDPRNPAVIADNVGDNVGDCAGMAADVFESYEVTLVAAIVLGAATSVIFPQEVWMKLIMFALMARGVGIIASIIGIFGVKGSDDVETDPLKPISKGFKVSAAVAAVLTAVLAWFMMGGLPSANPVIETSQLKSTQVYLRTEQAKIKTVQEDLAKRVAAAKAEVNAIIIDLAKKSETYKGDTKLVTADDVMKDPRVRTAMSKLGFTMAPEGEIKESETAEQKEKYFTPEEFKALVVTSLIGSEATATKKFESEPTKLTADLAIEDPRFLAMAKDQGMELEPFKMGVLAPALQVDPTTPQPDIPKLDGFTKVDWNAPEIQNYTVSLQAGAFGQPAQLESFVTKFKDAKLDDQYIVYKLKITRRLRRRDLSDPRHSPRLCSTVRF